MKAPTKPRTLYGLLPRKPGKARREHYTIGQANLPECELCDVLMKHAPTLDRIVFPPCPVCDCVVRVELAPLNTNLSMTYNGKDWWSDGTMIQVLAKVRYLYNAPTEKYVAMVLEYGVTEEDACRALLTKLEQLKGKAT